MGTHVYAVAPVFQDLRPAETYAQLADLLGSLEAVSSALFARVQDRLAVERQRLEALSARAALAGGKVAALRGGHGSRATKVHSPAQYPGAAPPAHVPLYPDADAGRGLVHRGRSRLVRAAPLPGPAPRDTLFQELLDLAPVERRGAAAAATAQEEGLGRLPERLPSVSSLLLFNSPANPYRKYLSLDDNLAARLGKQRSPEAAAAAPLHDAPHSVAQGESLLAPEAEQLAYRPVLGDVPLLNLPAALDLPMVAADLAWSAVPGAPAAASIAPSSLPALPDLALATPGPALSPAVSAAAPPPAAPPGPVAAPAARPPAPPASAAPPPPPPPAPVASGSDGPAAPPPPPPPDDVPAEVAEALGGRGSLLEDIRRGHKNRLRKTKGPAADGEQGQAAGGAEASDRKKKGGKKGESGAPKEPPAGTGDIFSDLISALNRRRNNMAGRGDPSARPAASAKSDAAAARGDDISLPAAAPSPSAAPAEEDWDE